MLLTTLQNYYCSSVKLCQAHALSLKSCQSNSDFQESQYEKSNGLDVNTLKIWVDLLPNTGENNEFSKPT